METLSRTATTRRLTWRRLLWAAALLNLAGLIVVGAAMGDREALGFAGLFAVGLVMLRIGGGIAGALIVAVLALNAAAWLAPAAVVNVTNREQVADVLIPASLALISLTASIAAVASIVRRRAPGDDGRAVRLVVQTAIAVFVLAAGAAVVQEGERQGARPGDVAVRMNSITFTPETMVADAGEITFAVSNGDLFWHTFTIDELDLDVGLPTRGDRRVTRTVPSGTYVFYCAIPGHKLAGMEGTLTVR